MLKRFEKLQYMVIGAVLMAVGRFSHSHLLQKKKSDQKTIGVFLARFFVGGSLLLTRMPSEH